jgi:hypothetical protein
VATGVVDYFGNRQTAGLDGDRAELNAKLGAIARYFDLDWLTADGTNALQLLWKSRDAIATNELLNFGDAVENFQRVDVDWLRKRVSLIKTADEGNRAGAIFELLGLNTYLSAGNKVVPFGELKSPLRRGRGARTPVVATCLHQKSWDDVVSKTFSEECR